MVERKTIMQKIIITIIITITFSFTFADTYVVRSGDTVRSIASAYRIHPQLLRELNGSNLVNLRVGQKLIVPQYGINNTFLSVVASMESGGIVEFRRDVAVGDHGNAIGRYQLWKAYVDDVNQWRQRHGLPTFTYNDRCNRYKAEAMVVTYMLRYHKTASVINALRLHNGGPGWRNMKKTIAYANKAMIKFWPKAR